MSILNEIFTHKRVELAAAKDARPEVDVERQAMATPIPPDFVSALQDQAKPAPRLIAEVKHRSPSKSFLRSNFDPLSLAQTYARNGAAAISVLTDEKYFGGSLDHLSQISAFEFGLPLLRKDFIFDRYQVWEARAAGASAVLLIVAMLDQSKLETLIATATDLHLTPFIEVHSQSELDRALSAGAPVIGINNRDLNTFTVSLKTTLTLRSYVPKDVPLVSESGIHTPEDVARLAVAGVDAMLVGESLVTAEDVGAQVRKLTNAE